MKIDYSQNFTNPAKCRRSGATPDRGGIRRRLQRLGACGLGALRAAKDEGVWGVGVDIDQAYLGPTCSRARSSSWTRAWSTVVQRFVRGKLAGRPEHRLRSPQRRRRARAASARRSRAPSSAGSRRSARRSSPARSGCRGLPLTRSAWVPTQTAPSPTATEIGCGATHTTARLALGRRVDSPEVAASWGRRSRAPSPAAQLGRVAGDRERNPRSAGQRGRVQVPARGLPVPERRSARERRRTARETVVAPTGPRRP